MKTFGKIVDAVLSIYMFKNCSHPRDCNIPSTSRVGFTGEIKSRTWRIEGGLAFASHRASLRRKSTQILIDRCKMMSSR